MTDKEKIHQILSSLWKSGDNSVGKTYYNQALQDVQTAIDLQEEPISEELEKKNKIEILANIIFNAAKHGYMPYDTQDEYCAMEIARKNIDKFIVPKKQEESGYQQGYEQAEKDLELTWKDMMLIHRYIKDAMNYHLYKMMEGAEGQKVVYQEVLKRFKEQRTQQYDIQKI